MQSRLGKLFLWALLLALHATSVYAELRFAVVDVYGKERLEQFYSGFARYLGEALKTPIKLVPIKDRKQCLTLLQKGELDLVLSGPAEYVVFSEHHKVQSVIGLKRADYFSLVVVRSDSGLRVPTDLRGKQVMFGDNGSTSGHLGAAQLLADHGLMPGRDYDFGNDLFEDGAARLAQKKVAALGLGSNQFLLLLKRYPDIPFHAIARGRDLPADLLLASKSVSPKIVAALRQVFTQQGDAVRKNFQSVPRLAKYHNVQFISVDDNEYNYVRAMYRTVNRPQIGVFIGD